MPRSYLPSKLSACIYHPGTRVLTSSNRHCGILVKQRHVSPDSPCTSLCRVPRGNTLCPRISQLADSSFPSGLRDPSCQHTLRYCLCAFPAISSLLQLSLLRCHMASGFPPLGGTHVTVSDYWKPKMPAWLERAGIWQNPTSCFYLPVLYFVPREWSWTCLLTSWSFQIHGIVGKVKGEHLCTTVICGSNALNVNSR